MAAYRNFGGREKIAKEDKGSVVSGTRRAGRTQRCK